MKNKIKRDYVLSVAINEQEHEMLLMIAREIGMTKSEAIRWLIRVEFEGRFGKDVA